MWFHFLVIGLLLLLSVPLFLKGEKKWNKKIYLWLSFFILFFISAFRSVNIGNDTSEYVRLFNFFGTENNILELSTRFEIGYVVFNKILYSLSSNHLILFIVTSLFIIGVWMIFIYKNSNMVWISVFLFINLRIYYFTLSGLRQAISMAILLISYKFLKERKFVPFLSLILIASLFHSSALIFLIVYPLSKIKFNRRFLTVQTIVGILIFVAFDSFINIIFMLFPQYQHYASGVYFTGDVQIASVLNFLVLLIILLLGIFTLNQRDRQGLIDSNYIKTKNKTPNINEKNILLHIISLGTLTYFAAINANMLDRIGIYFLMFSIIFIPKAIENISDQKLKILTTYLILIFVLAYNALILIYRPEWQHIYPYEFFWQI